MDPQHTNLLCLPGAIWHSSILPQLSLFDMCRLECAIASRSLLPQLRAAFAETVMQHEVIVVPDAIKWVTDKKIKLLRVKIVEEVSEEELLLITQHCPQLISLSTWDFEPDTQAVHKRLCKRRNRLNKLARIQFKIDAFDGFYEDSEDKIEIWSEPNGDPSNREPGNIEPSGTSTRNIDTGTAQATTTQDSSSDSDSDRSDDYRRSDDATVLAILQNCPHLKHLRMHEMVIVEWCQIFVHNIARLSQLDEVSYQEADYCTNDDQRGYDDYTQRFSITHTSFRIETYEPVEMHALLPAIAAHYPQLTSIWLESHSDVCIVDSGVLELATRCTGLQGVVLRAAAHSDTLLELCRLCPNLMELQVTGFVWNHEPVIDAIQLLPGLRKFYCEVHAGFEEPGEENVGNMLYRAVAEGLRELRVLRVRSTNCMSLTCWEDILRKCTHLHTVEIEGPSDQYEIDMLVAHGIGVITVHEQTCY